MELDEEAVEKRLNGLETSFVKIMRRKQHRFEKHVEVRTRRVCKNSEAVFREYDFPKEQLPFSILLTGNAERTEPDEFTVVRDIVREGTTTSGVVLLTPYLSGALVRL